MDAKPSHCGSSDAANAYHPGIVVELLRRKNIYRAVLAHRLAGPEHTHIGIASSTRAQYPCSYSYGPQVIFGQLPHLHFLLRSRPGDSVRHAT